MRWVGTWEAVHNLGNKKKKTIRTTGTGSKGKRHAKGFGLEAWECPGWLRKPWEALVSLRKVLARMYEGYRT